MPGFAKADGKNTIDGNRIPAGQLGAGYPCFGQVGWATNVGGVFKPSPCYAWNNTLNGAPLCMEVSRRADANEAATIKEGRDFFNEKPPAECYGRTSIRTHCNEGRDVRSPRGHHSGHWPSAIRDVPAGQGGDDGADLFQRKC